MTEKKELAWRIERRIREIPARNGAYIEVCDSKLSRILSSSLLKKIAEEAADEALSLNADKEQSE